MQQAPHALLLLCMYARYIKCAAVKKHNTKNMLVTQMRGDSFLWLLGSGGQVCKSLA